MEIQFTQEEIAELVALRRDFHTYPELGFEELRTAQRVEEELTTIGCPVERWCQTGISTVFESQIPGPTVLLRGDLDALPIQEENTHAYSSKNPGVMHACGHDAHTAILLGVAKLLHRKGWPEKGKIVLLFQPAEEGRHGAEAVIDAGFLRKYQPDVCAGLHVWSEADAGVCHVNPGPFMAATNRFKVNVQGQGGHGAVPHSAKDPIVSAALMITGLQTLVSREVDPAESAVVTVGQFHGGESFNVIPDAVFFEGTLRTFSKAVQAHLEMRIADLVEGIAKATGVTATVEMERVTLPTVNAEAPTALMSQIVKRTPGVRLGSNSFRTMAGEDMSFILDQVPGVFFFLGAGNPAVGAAYPHHHPKFEIDETVLPLGVRLLTEFALESTEASPPSPQG